MERVNRILNHPVFLEKLAKNQAAEADRRFCRHGMEHFLDVARIGMILNLQENLQIEQEWIYGAALLHDIGKHLQYEKGIPHEKASGEIAPAILLECGFSEKEAEVITEAIYSHRNPAVKEEKNLKGLLYRADKASRACFACGAEADCNWKDDRKNKVLKL